MPKKKQPSTLMLKDPNNILGTLVTLNRCARKAYPNNPTQRLHPIRRDRDGKYYREDQNEVRKQGERVRAQEHKRLESLRRESEAAKKMSRLQKANQGDAAKPGTDQGEVRTPPVAHCDRDRENFKCADQDG